mmetsp:Transcript_66408/g.158910  ORF Transcript_66408/g.158910 Transcript_66408/m.158910 type:complete len:244 (+) Transcript_66408:350-1081(+)
MLPSIHHQLEPAILHGSSGTKSSCHLVHQVDRCRPSPSPAPTSNTRETLAILRTMRYPFRRLGFLHKCSLASIERCRSASFCCCRWPWCPWPAAESCRGNLHAMTRQQREMASQGAHPLLQLLAAPTWLGSQTWHYDSAAWADWGEHCWVGCCRLGGARRRPAVPTQSHFRHHALCADCEQAPHEGAGSPHGLHAVGPLIPAFSAVASSIVKEHHPASSLPAHVAASCRSACSANPPAQSEPC